MLTKHLFHTIIFAFAVTALLSSSRACAQHVHGSVELGIVVENHELSVTLHAPMSDVVGFEHEPRTDKQRERIRRVAALLTNPDDLIGTPDAAGCTVESLKLDAPDFVTRHGNAEQHDHHDDDHHGDDEDSVETHDETHDETHAEEHSEVRAEMRWHCDDASRLNSLQPLFVNAFENVEDIEILIVGADGARVIDADRSIKSISLGVE